MSGNKTHSPKRLIFLAVCVLVFSRPVIACSVCFGDPESPMTKGAAAGILVLGGIIASVLMGIVGTGLFWMSRGRRLARCDGRMPERADSDWATWTKDELN